MDNKYKGGEALNRIIDGHGEPINLKFSLLEDITDNFSDLRKIGHGGCGQVYKGIFANRFIAVKKLFNDRTWDDKMFNSEVKSLIKAKHPNIVNFFGYCCNTEEKFQQVGGVHIRAEIRERLLCFEFIPNGSLENYLTDELRGLEWCTRYQIIEGICSGLCHLHKDVGIIHMDLKPANILLDGHFPDLVPKITDFGLARLADVSKTTSQDRLLSLGYCAPEYEKSGHMSIKSDIYSLGVIILELMTGSKKTPSTINVRLLLPR
ncbi:hypothetical protein PR202_ga24575 [Eleusine coracana subsp. coracana]|uniref:Protein kinase domain-containing protein n=1 Tax=Eleusine coracana subsp. coracana TaxID=191504 RepID=A0AAV5D9B2_ELECO|nr:hypothetical protein PR202_ga24575 [Eleusine coracana subsp. coracana]